MTAISAKIKEVKRKRIYRFLRSTFNRRDFDFQWTDLETAYFDGKTIFVRYDVNRPEKNKEYTVTEQQIIHFGLSYHEMGHKLYDLVEHFSEWLKENSSTDRSEWESNTKWPFQVVRTWGNLGLDGRIESFLKNDYPFTRGAIDFMNYEWACLESDESARGKNKINDYFELFQRRILGMTDLDGWCKEAIDLYDAHQDLIEAAKLKVTTRECLDTMKEHLIQTWPILYEWMKEEKQEPESIDSTYPLLEDVDQSLWGASEEVLQNATRAVKRVQNAQNSPSEDSKNSGHTNQPSDEENALEDQKKPFKPNFDRLIRQAEKEMTSIEEEANEELAEEVEREIFVNTTYHNKSISNKIIETVPEDFDEDIFEQYVVNKRRTIMMLKNVLQLILEPVPEERLRNQRQGRLQQGRVWRALKCNDANIRTFRKEGLPNQNASITFMCDVSGSTCVEGKNGKSIIEEMKEALAVILTAAHKAKVPTKAFAFTSDMESTFIYRLKPHDTKFKPQYKGAIGGLQPQIGNRDVAALQYLINEVATRHEDIRLAFMISDGAPNFYDDENEDTIRQMVKSAEKKGIDVFCIYVGTDDNGYQIAKSMYGERVIRSHMELVNDLKRKLVKVLAKRRGL